MPRINSISAIRYKPVAPGGDISTYLAPPYDVLDAAGKQRLLDGEPRNIVAIDLPHYPAKTAGPDAVYDQAAQVFSSWLADGTLVRQDRPTVFVYEQTYTATPPGAKAPQTFTRRGLIANVGVQPFGERPDGLGAVMPHEQTFSGPKEDRMKLMQATRAQLSPIFGLYSDPQGTVNELMGQVVSSGPPTFYGTTGHDGSRHAIWAVEDQDLVTQLTTQMSAYDVFIADGHHRYTTALNYWQGRAPASAGVSSPRQPSNSGATALQDADPASNCLFVLVAMQDPGLIVLPTHRVVGGLEGFTWDQFRSALENQMEVRAYEGDLAGLEEALPEAGPHAIGLYAVPEEGGEPVMAIATTRTDDPLASSHPDRDAAWRGLDVAVAQHVIVEGVCQERFCPGSQVKWLFPHSLDELRADVQGDGYQLGLVMQPTPLESVMQVSQAGELMPQKSTFFYPKLATGLVINPLE